MGTPLNKTAYEKLIEENLAWLLAQPRTLERDHIEQIVRHSTAMLYPAKEPVQQDDQLVSREADGSLSVSVYEDLFKQGDRVRVTKIED